jgi:hypothetical protein
MAALFTVKPTLVLGKRHLILATSPELAKEALDLESSSDARWVPSGDFAQAVEGLPSRLVYLQVADPRETLPKAITALPTALENAITSFRSLTPQVAGAPGAPGAPPPFGPNPGAEPGVAGRFGGRGAGPGGGRTLQGAPPTGGFAGPPGGPPGASGGYPGASGGYPGASGGPQGGYAGRSFGPPAGASGAAPAAGAPPAATGPVKLQIAAEDMPKASEIRPHLFPGSFVVTVDDQAIRMIGRDAFFGIDSAVELLSALPMIAAQVRGAQPSGSTSVAAPGAFPGAPGSGFPGFPGNPGAAGNAPPPPGAFPGLSGAPPGGSSGGTRA